MNIFYAHINVTEPYCGVTSNPLIETLKFLTSVIKSDLLPKCPIQGHVGAINVTVDSTFIEYSPLYFQNGQHYIRLEYLTEKFESIFYLKLFYIGHQKSIAQSHPFGQDGK
jgi:hypothetical protein